jgi:uncharacterized protein
VTESFRILALDGGGMRGIFTAAYLAEIEDALGTPITDSVDLITGTSTGGIIALGLASGRSAAEMLSFYSTHGPEIFRRPRHIRRMFRPKYDRAGLDRALQREFGEIVMNDLYTPVCITAHELVEGTTRVIKDDHSPELRWGGGLPVWKVAAATSAAPTYFAPVQLDAEDCHVDGGVWANNPALVGITEAVRYLERDLSDIRMLSVGTTSKILRAKSFADAQHRGLLGWARETIDLLQGTVSMASHRQACLLLPDGQYLRIDDELAEKLPLDDVDGCRALRERGQQKGRLTVRDVRRLLAIDATPAS